MFFFVLNLCVRVHVHCIWRSVGENRAGMCTDRRTLCLCTLDFGLWTYVYLLQRGNGNEGMSSATASASANSSAECIALHG